MLLEPGAGGTPWNLSFLPGADQLDGTNWGGITVQNLINR